MRNVSAIHATTPKDVVYILAATNQRIYNTDKTNAEMVRNYRVAELSIEL